MAELMSIREIFESVVRNGWGEEGRSPERHECVCDTDDVPCLANHAEEENA